jgi:hypothetical protein
MSALSRKLCLGCVLLWSVTQSFGFTMQGVLAPWQTPRLGYDLNAALFGGPMNLGEEYRWNVPVVYYAFTPEFLNYFGQKGVDEVEKAIKFMNDLPPVSQLNIDDYPLTSQRINHRAEALFLVDLKSEALSFLLQGAGLTDPTRYVYTLRNRWISPGGAPTNYYVIKRNFDPVTLHHSSFINGTLWTYGTILDGPVRSIAVNSPVDPLALNGLISAPVTSGFVGGNGLLTQGGFWTGLTRDDVGGLKYIYHANNYNVENPSPNAFTGFGITVPGGGGGSPWSIPAPITNAPPGTVVTNNFITTATRPGIEKVSYQRVNFDSLLGFFEPFTNAWTDTIVTNGVSRTQTLLRPQPSADILFDAADLQDGDDNAGVVVVQASSINWTNNAALNGLFNAAANFGPGVIQPAQGGAGALVLTFNSVGPILANVYPAFLSEANAAIVAFLWGSFDGSTNEPVVYPVGTSIRQVEAQVLGSQ